MCNTKKLFYSWHQIFKRRWRKWTFMTIDGRHTRTGNKIAYNNYNVCNLHSIQPSPGNVNDIMTKSQTPLNRFVVDLLWTCCTKVPSGSRGEAPVGSLGNKIPHSCSRFVYECIKFRCFRNKMCTGECFCQCCRHSIHDVKLSSSSSLST